MAEDAPRTEGPFDLDRLRQLFELMEKHGLTDVSLQQGEERLRLRRGPVGMPSLPPMPAMLPPALQSSVPAAAAPQAAAEPAGERLLDIKSPTVGTFYAAASPDDPPLVSVGTRVSPDTIVCIVEAMKVFNQIPAEVSGTIAAVLVNNGDSVEFGQPLFRVRPS